MMLALKITCFGHSACRGCTQLESQNLHLAVYSSTVPAHKTHKATACHSVLPLL